MHTEDIRELQTQLKCAQNDLKRYASHVVRLERELARERKNGDNQLHHEENTLASEDTHDRVINSITDESATIQRGIEQLIKQTTTRCELCNCQRIHGRESIDDIDPTTTPSVSFKSQLQHVQHLLHKQNKQIRFLARENAKLRDQLISRPKHRDLVRDQWHIESLQIEIRRLKERLRQSQIIHKANEAAKTSETSPMFSSPVYELTELETVTDQIRLDKLVSWLHVEAKHFKTNDHTRHKRMLQENVRCYLVLKDKVLNKLNASESIHDVIQQNREQISRRVGVLCSEIVASCCHTIGLENIAKLPRYLETTYQYTQVVPYLQNFVDNVHKVLMDGMTETSTKISKDEKYLDQLVQRVQDLVYEVQARRQQMAPPGSKAVDVVFRTMKLLQVTHVDNISTTIEKVLESSRADRDFGKNVRNLLGLDISATRTETLYMISQLMERIGFENSTRSKDDQRPNRSSQR